MLWKREEIAPEEQFLLLPTIFCYLMVDFYVKTRIRFSLRDKRLFEITEVEITRVDCSFFLPLVVIIDNINGDLNILHGLELLIPTSGTRTGNCDTRRKLTAQNPVKTDLLKI